MWSDEPLATGTPRHTWGSVVVREDLRRQLIGEMLFEQGSERFDGEVDQPGQV
jgi:hypothetical protein